MTDSMLHVSPQPITVDPSIAAFLNQLADAGSSLEEPDRILMPYFESGLKSSTRQGRNFQHWWKWVFCCSWRRVQMVEVRAPIYVSRPGANKVCVLRRTRTRWPKRGH
jgi:hypothetical protein